MLFSPKLIKDQRIEVQNFQVEINCVKELVPSASTTQLYNILFKKVLYYPFDINKITINNTYFNCIRF